MESIESKLKALLQTEQSQDSNLLPCEQPDAYKRVEWQPFVLNPENNTFRTRYHPGLEKSREPFPRVPTVQEYATLILAKNMGTLEPSLGRIVDEMTNGHTELTDTAYRRTKNTITFYVQPRGFKPDKSGVIIPTKNFTYIAERTFSLPPFDMKRGLTYMMQGGEIRVSYPTEKLPADIVKYLCTTGGDFPFSAMDIWEPCPGHPNALALIKVRYMEYRDNQNKIMLCSDFYEDFGDFRRRDVREKS